MCFSQQVATSSYVGDTIGCQSAELCSYQRDREDLEKENVELQRNLTVASKIAKDIDLKIVVLEKALGEASEAKE